MRPVSGVWENSEAIVLHFENSKRDIARDRKG
jgi:hypothetical protein